MSLRAKDPVCGGMINPAETKHKAEYSGMEFYFCSDACLGKFKASPEQMLKRKTP
jgi:Cu+-exporting ATPase